MPASTLSPGAEGHRRTFEAAAFAFETTALMLDPDSAFASAYATGATGGTANWSFFRLRGKDP